MKFIRLMNARERKFELPKNYIYGIDQLELTQYILSKHTNLSQTTKTATIWLYGHMHNLTHMVHVKIVF